MFFSSLWVSPLFHLPRTTLSTGVLVGGLGTWFTALGSHIYTYVDVAASRPPLLFLSIFALGLLVPVLSASLLRRDAFDDGFFSLFLLL